MIKNPIPVALAMLVNSFLSGLVHFLTKWTESLANCFSGSIKTSLNPSFSILIVRCYVYVVAVSLYRKKGNQMLEIAKEPSRKQAKRLRVRHLKRPPISISNEKLPDWTEWKTRQGPFATHKWIWTQTRNAMNFSKSRYKDHHVKYPIVKVNNWAIQTETSFCVVLCGKSSSTRLVCFSFGILLTSQIPSITPLSHLLYGQRALCVRREHHRPLAKATSKDDRFGPHNRYRIVRRTHYPVPCLLLAVRFYVSRIYYFWFFQHDLWISIYVRHPENVHSSLTKS